MADTNTQTIRPESLLWTAELGLRGGASVRFTLSLDKKRSLEDRLENWEYYHGDKLGIPFFWFESEHYFVHVNLGQPTHAKLMFDSIPLDEANSLTDCCESAPAIQVWMIGQQQPLDFEADPEEEPDEEGSFGQLNEMQANLGIDSPGLGFISFLDNEGERVFLRVADIAMITIPNWLLEQGLLDVSKVNSPVPTN